MEETTGSRQAEGQHMIRRGHSTPESNQRYWRRRANRRVRKARLTRTGARLVLLVLLNIAVAAILLEIGGSAFTRLVQSDEFSLSRIDIQGAQRSSTVDVQHNLRHLLGTNLFELDLRQIGSIAKQNPWVSSVSVKRILPDRIRIRIIERTPCLQAWIGDRAYLVDTTGFVIGPSGPGNSVDLPVLTGLEGLEQEALIQALRRGVTLLAELDHTSKPFTALISEMNIRHGDRVVVHTTDQRRRLFLDPTSIGRNVPRYLALRDEISRRIGQVDYVDLRWQDHISVRPPVLHGESR
jgi:cell division protein FtsQ